MITISLWILFVYCKSAGIIEPFAEVSLSNGPGWTVWAYIHTHGRSLQLSQSWKSRLKGCMNVTLTFKCRFFNPKRLFPTLTHCIRITNWDSFSKWNVNTRQLKTGGGRRETPLMWQRCRIFKELYSFLLSQHKHIFVIVTFFRSRQPCSSVSISEIRFKDFQEMQRIPRRWSHTHLVSHSDGGKASISCGGFMCFISLLLSPNLAPVQ